MSENQTTPRMQVWIAQWADYIEVVEWRGAERRIIEQRTTSFWLGRDGCPWRDTDG